jgi:maltooligosyltrehalose trehalohydrolase
MEADLNKNFTIEKRKYPVGAEIISGLGTHFRVWAPKRNTVSVVLEEMNNRSFPLEKENNGYFSGLVSDAKEGSLYRFKLDDDQSFYPDPASRFQPEGPHGPSKIINPGNYKWKSSDWKGINLKGQVIYELHIGTFTKEGTWNSASKELPELASIGITCIEIMPVADFPGRFGWGYDGVNLFAPARVYGTPEDFKSFIDEAHQNNIAVILDVVYNHLGPDGNYLAQFSDYYFNPKYETDWGPSINYDGDYSGPVREFILTNTKYWIEEFMIDGYRLDATQDIFDNSRQNILKEITSTAKKSAQEREIIIIAENEPQNIKLITHAEAGGYDMDGVWNDDFHHSAIVASTGMSEAYYTDYTGTSQEILSSVKYGYLFTGQRYKWQKKRRGTPAFNIEPYKFINYIQNHDQIANYGLGQRLHRLTSPGRYRAVTALLLLAPGTPLLFQGQEFAAGSPFLYFADHKEELNEIIKKGRGEFLAQFSSAASKALQERLDDPADEKTFLNSKIDFSEREINSSFYVMTKDLLALRKNHKAFSQQKYGAVDGAVLTSEAFVLRYFEKDEGDKVLVVNLGRNIIEESISEPLLVPAAGKDWKVLFATEDPKYGGHGIPKINIAEGWHFPPHSTIVFG